MASDLTSELSSLDNFREETFRKAPRERFEHDLINPHPDPAPKPPEDGPKYNFWDISQITTRDRRENNDDAGRSLQVIKAVAYILFFAILLLCSVAQKLSLMTLVANQYNGTAYAESAARERKTVAAGKHLLLAIAIMIPYCLTFLTSLFKWVFGSVPFPGFPAILFCIVMETIHSLGLCALVFIILPDMDIVRGICLLNGVAVLPSILYLFTAAERRYNGRRPMAVFSLNVFVPIVQVAFIPLVIFFDNFVAGSRIDNQSKTIVIFVVAMFFVSFSWWENFSDDRFCGRSINKTKFMKLKFNLQESRPVICFFTSLWKIGITCLLTWLSKTYKPFTDDNSDANRHHEIDDVTVADAFRKLADMPIKDNAAILTLTLTPFVGYCIAYITCKLKIQTFSFSLPMMLSTPVAVVFASLDCRPNFNLLMPFTNELRNMCEKHDDWNEWIGVYIAGIVVSVSLYWLCRHIFFPNIERLARIERLFMNPFYCSVLFEQHLILNRRRHNRRVVNEVDSDTDTNYYRLSINNFTVNIEGEEEEDESSSVDSEGEYADIFSDGYRNEKFRDIPMIYACATMWHETTNEMIQLMKSIFRMDRDQFIRRAAELMTGKEDTDFYDFEAHIFFDDAMELDEEGDMVPNSFVRELLSLLGQAVSSVYSQHKDLMQPLIVPTPYGGQIVYSMPGNNFLFIHLKDKTKIRHKKRWSQVMYMYYLLGYRIVRYCQETVTEALKHDRFDGLITWKGRQYGRSDILQAFDEQVLKRARNTYLLALDGDVDFLPSAVTRLVNRMKKSEKVAAVCGRIHPIGIGPVVWYQKFEYAIAHWLQKATEHVFGCVLCSPGCFSIFRGLALMDNNVMKQYTMLPTEASHHLMYDQGEDRWLCTLLLQKGYRVDYEARADAFTYAPEGFAEFFNQRRRWMPSTLFNIIDLLADYQNTVFINSNISMLYILYQGALLFSTIIGPATVLMMIAGANLIAFKTNWIESYILAMVPAVCYYIACFCVKPKHQILFAEILTGLYAFEMLIVLVGIIVTAIKESVFHPSVIFIVMLVIAFSFAALLHPKEWTYIIYGFLYFILMPTGYLLLVIYSMANMHVISWGTREVHTKKSKEEIEAEKGVLEDKQLKKKEQGFFGRYMPVFRTKKEESVSNTETLTLLKEINESIKSLVRVQREADENLHLQMEHNEETERKSTMKINNVSETNRTQIVRDSSMVSNLLSVSFSERKCEVIQPNKQTRDDLVNPKWAEIQEFQHCKKMPMDENELNFWNACIERYLYPLNFTTEKKKNVQKALKELRTNICVGLTIVNLMWIAINFMFQLTMPTKIDISSFKGTTTNEEDLEQEVASETTSSSLGRNNLEVDALGLLFIVFYILILMIQFAGMIMHRWGTFLHLVSITKLRNRMPKGAQGVTAKEARMACERMLQEPLPYYTDDEETLQEEENDKDAERQLKQLQNTGNRLKITANSIGQLSSSTRLLGQTLSTDVGQSMLTRLAKRFAYLPDRHAFLTSVTGVGLDKTRHNGNNLYNKQHDRQSPSRHNAVPGGSAMASHWDQFLLRRCEESELEPDDQAEADTPEDKLCAIISQQGTLGKALARRLQLYSQTSPVTRANGSQTTPVRRDRDRIVQFSEPTEMGDSSNNFQLDMY